MLQHSLPAVVAPLNLVPAAAAAAVVAAALPVVAAAAAVLLAAVTAAADVAAAAALLASGAAAVVDVLDLSQLLDNPCEILNKKINIFFEFTAPYHTFVKQKRLSEMVWSK